MAGPIPETSRNITLKVNGVAHTATVPVRKTLLDFVREELRLTGTKEGCGEGECGACTVLVDGEPVNACLVPVIQANGADVVTVEGVEREERLAPIQKCLIEAGGTQCGICTPGIVLTAKAFIEKNPEPGRPEIREALAGNLCRCTGYMQIVEAIKAAAGQIQGDVKGDIR